MNLKLPQLLAATGAIVLLYAAIKDVSPAAIIKAVLTGGALPQSSNSAGGSYDADGNFHPSVPDYLGGGEVGGPNANPNIVPYDPPPTGQHNPAYDGNGQPGGIPMTYTYRQPFPVVTV